MEFDLTIPEFLNPSILRSQVEFLNKNAYFVFELIRAGPGSRAILTRGEVMAMVTEVCLLGDFRFKSGERVCEERRCFVCKDGNWQERFEDRAFSVGP